MAKPFVRGGTTYYYTDEEYDALVRSDPGPFYLPNPKVRTIPVLDGSQAQQWLADVLGNTPQTPMGAGDEVAKVLASLCGEDSKVTITRRKLTEAVGGPRWFTDDGVRLLETHGWLTVETTGKGRGASTTFYLTPGERKGSRREAAASETKYVPPCVPPSVA